MKQTRPLSPHLSIYKIQISSTLSILHRITGVVAFLGLLTFAWLLIILLIQDMKIMFVDQDLTCIFTNKVFQAFMISVVCSFYYHFFNGIRHLCWDIGVGFSITAMHWSGYTVILLSVATSVLTLYCVIKGW